MSDEWETVSPDEILWDENAEAAYEEGREAALEEVNVELLEVLQALTKAIEQARSAIAKVKGDKA